MADVTDVLAIPFPEGGDTFAATGVQGLAERVDETPGIESLTAAEIAALASAQKPAGRVVYNSDTSKLQVSNGTSFANIDATLLPLAGGTMSGVIAMGSQKITGLADGSASTDAAAYGQVSAVSAVASAALPAASVRAATVGTVSYTTGGVAVSFSSALASKPLLVIGQTVAVGSATPLHIMPFGVTTSGFSYKAFTLDGAERAAAAPVTFDYLAVIV